MQKSVVNLGGRFLTSSTASIFQKFSQYCCETSIIQIQESKNFFLGRKLKKKSLYYRHCIVQTNFLAVYLIFEYIFATKIENTNGFW